MSTPDDRPRIGISTYQRPASFGAWRDVAACLVPRGYVDGVRAAGGVAILLPPAADAAATYLDAIHGLVLVGGEDIDATRYGAAAHVTADAPNVERDASELALLRGALERDLPYLGICRGFQLLNVAFGGDLEQHLADRLPMEAHRAAVGVFGRHPVVLDGGHAARLLGRDVADVHSHHHQGLGRVGEGLVVTGRAPDGTVEAVEDPARPFCLGVLWHPEEAWSDTGAPLFAGVVEAARAYRDAGVG